MMILSRERLGGGGVVVMENGLPLGRLHGDVVIWNSYYRALFALAE